MASSAPLLWVLAPATQRTGGLLYWTGWHHRATQQGRILGVLPGPLLPPTHTYIQSLCQAEDRGQGREALKGPGLRVCHDLEYHEARNSWTAQQPRLSAWQLLPLDLPRLCPPWATCVDWPLVHQAGLKPLSSTDHNVGLRFFARVCRLYRNFSLLGLLGREEREDNPGNSRAPPPPRSCPVPPS